MLTQFLSHSEWRRSSLSEGVLLDPVHHSEPGQVDRDRGAQNRHRGTGASSSPSFVVSSPSLTVVRLVTTSDSRSPPMSRPPRAHRARCDDAVPSHHRELLPQGQSLYQYSSDRSVSDPQTMLPSNHADLRRGDRPPWDCSTARTRSRPSLLPRGGCPTSPRRTALRSQLSPTRFDQHVQQLPLVSLRRRRRRNQRRPTRPRPQVVRTLARAIARLSRQPVRHQHRVQLELNPWEALVVYRIVKSRRAGTAEDVDHDGGNERRWAAEPGLGE